MSSGRRHKLQDPSALRTCSGATIQRGKPQSTGTRSPTYTYYIHTVLTHKSSHMNTHCIHTHIQYICMTRTHMHTHKCTRVNVHTHHVWLYVFQGRSACSANQVPGEIHLSETVQTVASKVNKDKNRERERSDGCV